MSIIETIIEYVIQNVIPFHKDFKHLTKLHSGKYCQIIIGRFETTIGIHNSNVYLSTMHTSNQIILTVNDLYNLLTPSKTKPKAEFKGDIQLCQDLARILSQNKIDLEGLMYNIFPDPVAMASIEGSSLIKKHYLYSKTQLVRYLKDYLTYETGICVSKEEANPLYEKTLRLKWIVDSLKV